jgi:arylamine N-acetyltransferase
MSGTTETERIRSDNPLAPPGDRRLLASFLEHFGLGSDIEPRRLLREVAAAFANLPYENLTKIIKGHETSSVREAKRLPDEVLADHRALGTGGTCFSLTATFLYLLRSLGWRAEPLLADRRYGENTHCALVVWIEGQPHLVDPGYLIVDPIPLDSGGETRLTTAFNELILSPQARGDKLDLSTVSQGRQTYRLTFKASPVDESEFLRAWDASFDWDMMRYPVLTRVCGHRQLYLQGSRFQTRSREVVQRREIPTDELVGRIAAEFGIDPQVAARALAALKRKGEPYG